jgi:hypothetical protein
MLQANFRLFHAACDASVAGEAEGDQSILGFFLRPKEQMTFQSAAYPGGRSCDADFHDGSLAIAAGSSVTNLFR